MAKLDDPQLRTDLVRAVTGGCTIRQAAAAAGISPTTVMSYAKAHEDFGAELEAARFRAKAVAHHAPRMLQSPSPSTTSTEQGSDDPDTGALDTVDRAKFVALLWKHATDETSKGCPKALDILAQLHFAEEILAMKASAARKSAALEAEDAPEDKLQVRLMLVAESKVIDVEAD